MQADNRFAITIGAGWLVHRASNLARWVLRQQTLLVLTILFGIGLAATIWHTAHLSSTLVRTMAQEGTEAYAEAIEELRGLYTSEVVERMRPHGIRVTHDYQNDDKAIPLPATLTMKLGERLAAGNSKMEVRLYSDYPFPWQSEGGPRDDFEREAIHHLREKPDDSFVRIENHQGQPSLRLARADRMRASCVDCHNSHPDSPKRDWKEGDVRGVLEVVRPLSTATAQTRSAIQFSVMLVGTLSVLGVVGLFIVTHTLHQNASKLEGRVTERTFDLAKAAEALKKEAREHERTAQALQSTVEQLAQAQKLQAIGTLAGGVAHEFNNLLQVIQGYTHFAQDGLAKDDPRRQDLDQVLRAAERAATLTKQLLGFSRRQVLNRVASNPNRLVAEAVKMFRPLIGEHIELRLVLGRNVGTVLIDHTEFQQMLMNLCVNARDAMPSGGDLLIKTDSVVVGAAYSRLHPDVRPGRYLELTITDTGCGMPPEVKERIFEPFYTTKEVGRGTGLGLAMVYGLVQQHRGAIHVYSEVDQGTTFKIYLPVESTEAEAEDRLPAAPPAGGAETILVAEDEPLIRDLAVRVLQGAGYQTITACNGDEALRIFAERKDEIDLAMLDIVMPKRGGREVYRYIQSLKPELPTLFCSGYDPETSQAEDLVAEGLRLIQKPINPDLLLVHVRDLLDKVPQFAH